MQLADGVERHKPCRGGVVARHRLARDPAAIEYGDQIVRRELPGRVVPDYLVDVQGAGQLRRDAGLLAHLAQGSRTHRLARLDTAAGKAPQALQRPALATLDEQQLAAAEDGGAGGTTRPHRSSHA